jgi:hypothetical protein
MPRKALATARAALRSAHRAGDERGLHHRPPRQVWPDTTWHSLRLTAIHPTYQCLPEPPWSRWTARHHVGTSTTRVATRSQPVTTGHLSERTEQSLSTPGAAMRRFRKKPVAAVAATKARQLRDERRNATTVRPTPGPDQAEGIR